MLRVASTHQPPKLLGVIVAARATTETLTVNAKNGGYQGCKIHAHAFRLVTTNALTCTYPIHLPTHPTMHERISPDNSECSLDEIYGSYTETIVPNEGYYRFSKTSIETYPCHGATESGKHGTCKVASVNNSYGNELCVDHSWGPLCSAW